MRCPVEEKILGVVPNFKKSKSWGRWDTYSLVVTDQSFIFAMMTSQMVKDAAAEAQKSGKESGKGFFARWGDQIKSGFILYKKYYNMPAEAILDENKDNFQLLIANISRVTIRKKTGDENQSDTTEIKIEAVSGKQEYFIDGSSKEMIGLFEAVLGDRLDVKKGIFGLG
ncbi:hypothetical protein B1772_04985 [Dehalococcoides mccartyi]|jgi:hypothetical protein|nr:hypothetical protein B1776_04675 [Dehalococcoides mccartyi]AQY73423.1 hypothetical protein B1772_04985 [Dehalococcoides mccartyi]